jgi:hypothetical protein
MAFPDEKSSPQQPDRSGLPVRLSKLADQGNEDDLSHLTPAECLAMMWPLALDAWAFMGKPIVESEASRQVDRVIRGKRESCRSVSSVPLWLATLADQC